MSLQDTVKALLNAIADGGQPVPFSSIEPLAPFLGIVDFAVPTMVSRQGSTVTVLVTRKKSRSLKDATVTTTADKVVFTLQVLGTDAIEILSISGLEAERGPIGGSVKQINVMQLPGGNLQLTVTVGTIFGDLSDTITVDPSGDVVGT